MSEIDNLYDLHTDPKSLFGYSTRSYRIPELAWERAIREPELKNLLEPTIAKSAYATYEYAMTTGKRFIPGEPSLLHNSHFALKYFKRFFRPNRWPELEKTITTPIYAAQYAMVLGKPTPEREKLIATSGTASLTYARYVLGGRFPAGEKDGLLKSPAAAAEYRKFLEENNL